MITLYSTHCPKCNVLEAKLIQNNIDYVLNTDEEEMIKLGFSSAPMLGVDGEYKDFMTAIQWINNRSEKNEYKY